MLNCFPGLVHKGSWRRLQMESCALRQRGFAQGTWANKVSHLRQYIAFCTYYGVQDFPVHLGIILRFIAFLGRGSLAHKSATNILASLRWFTNLLDPPSVKTFEAVLVSASLKGLKAQLSRPVRQKLPFTIDHLCKFYKLLDMCNVKHVACWCAMLLAFFGCLRLSNLVPVSKKLFDPLKHLKRDDISFENDVVLIFYKWSKTNQSSGKVSWIPICHASDKRFNIKFFLKKLFALVKAPSDASLFSFSSKDHHSRFSLVRLLDNCVFQAGLSPSDYSWHSFRRGAAVFAFELGLADTSVQLFGDWSSLAFKHYLEFAYGRKVSVSRKIAKNFDRQLKQF